MAFLKLVIVGAIALTVIYFSIALYSRSVRREKLEKHWDADPPEGADAEARRAYIEQGMEDYYHGFRRKLILLVYVVPTVAVAIILYVINAN